MAITKVSALTAKTTPTGSEEVLINDGGTSKKITIANLTKGHDLPTVPSGIDTDTNKEYNLKLTDVSGTETLTWIEETDNDTTYSNFVGDDGVGGVTTAAGLVPAPTEGDAAAGKYLDSDGNWTVPPDTDTDTTYSNFAGTTAGLVPTSTTGDDTKFLRADGTWVVPTDTDTGITDVVDDTTPQLGGSLDVNGNSIVSASNGDIAITPHGTGDVVLDGLKYPSADGTAGYVLKTNGSAQLSWVAQTTDTDTTYTSSDFTHDSLSGVTANEHLDWTADQSATNIHSGNYTDTDTTYTASGVVSIDGSNVITSTGEANAANTAITSSAQAFTEDQTFEAITETVTAKSAGFTPDLSNDGTVYNVTGAVAVTMPTAESGKSFTIIASAPVSSWTGTIKWASATVPTGTGICIYTFISDGTNWYAFEAGNAFG